MAKYEKTRKYRSAIAMKGVKTRRKNAVLAHEVTDVVEPSQLPSVPQAE